MSYDFTYKPGGEVLRDFLKDNSFFRGIRGPVGSGTSSACCVEIFRRASEQQVGQDGKRRSRWAVIRNTNPQLRTTTFETSFVLNMMTGFMLPSTTVQLTPNAPPPNSNRVDLEGVPGVPRRVRRRVPCPNKNVAKHIHHHASSTTWSVHYGDL